MSFDLPPPPPPPADAISLVSSGGESSVAAFSLEPDWAPNNYLEKSMSYRFNKERNTCKIYARVKFRARFKVA